MKALIAIIVIDFVLLVGMFIYFDHYVTSKCTEPQPRAQATIDGGRLQGSLNYGGF